MQHNKGGWSCLFFEYFHGFYFVNSIRDHSCAMVYADHKGYFRRICCCSLSALLLLLTFLSLASGILALLLGFLKKVVVFIVPVASFVCHLCKCSLPLLLCFVVEKLGRQKCTWEGMGD